MQRGVLRVDRNRQADTPFQIILCIGETLQEREKDITMQVVERQLEAVSGCVEEKDWK